MRLRLEKVAAVTAYKYHPVGLTEVVARTCGQAVEIRASEESTDAAEGPRRTRGVVVAFAVVVAPVEEK